MFDSVSSFVVVDMTVDMMIFVAVLIAFEYSSEIGAVFYVYNKTNVEWRLVIS